MPAKQNKGRLSSAANQVAVFRGLLSSNSQNDVTGTRQRLAGPSQRRQCGLAVLWIFVTGSAPNCGGQGIHHRIITSSRPASVLRTTGAIASAKIVGNSGRLPVLSSVARVNSRIDYWSFVML